MNWVKTILSIVFVAILSGYSCSQNADVDNRLHLVTEFVNALKKSNISNEEVIKKFVYTESYFSNDSAKQIADFYLNLMRELKDSDVRVIKYLDNEEEFAVSDVQDIGSNASASQNLEFEISKWSDKTRKKVNKADLYVVKAKPKNGIEKMGGGIFILFNDQNKIISFAGMRQGYKVGLMQF